MKPRGGEGQNGRLKCPVGLLVTNSSTLISKIIVAKLNSCVKMVFGGI